MLPKSSKSFPKVVQSLKVRFQRLPKVTPSIKLPTSASLQICLETVDGSLVLVFVNNFCGTFKDRFGWSGVAMGLLSIVIKSLWVVMGSFQNCLESFMGR